MLFVVILGCVQVGFPITACWGRGVFEAELDAVFVNTASPLHASLPISSQLLHALVKKLCLGFSPRLNVFFELSELCIRLRKHLLRVGLGELLYFEPPWAILSFALFLNLFLFC